MHLVSWDRWFSGNNLEEKVTMQWGCFCSKITLRLTDGEAPVVGEGPLRGGGGVRVLQRVAVDGDLEGLVHAAHGLYCIVLYWLYCTVLYCTACTDRVVPRLKDLHGLYLAAGGKNERGVARLV